MMGNRSGTLMGAVSRVGAVLAGGLAAGCAGGDAGGPAEVPVLQLGEPDAFFAEPFSVVSTVREMADGQVLVADPLSQVLMRMDFDAGTADTIGRVGQGPEEYRQPDAVWPLPGGRTLLVDLGNGRLTELGPDLEFGDTRPYAVGDPMAGTMVVAIPQGVDALGRIYFRAFASMGGPPPDSAAILRWDAATESMDTVAMFKTAGTTREVSGGPDNQSESISQIPLSPADAWGVAADGRVAIVRAGDYHVDWIEADGSITSGPPVPWDPVAIGRAEKLEWLDSRGETGGGLSIRATNENGSLSIFATRGGGPGEEDLDGYPWPEAKAAFHDRPVPVDGVGRAWVRRHREAGEAPRYDVFDGGGQLVMRVELALGRRVVGFGDGTVYAVRMDEVGLHYLERHALP